MKIGLVLHYRLLWKNHKYFSKCFSRMAYEINQAISLMYAPAVNGGVAEFRSFKVRKNCNRKNVNVRGTFFTTGFHLEI